jgi:hypothetical protein
MVLSVSKEFLNTPGYSKALVNACKKQGQNIPLPLPGSKSISNNFFKNCLSICIVRYAAEKKPVLQFALKSIFTFVCVVSPVSYKKTNETETLFMSFTSTVFFFFFCAIIQ